MHTQETPFQCARCLKAYSRSNSLFRHERKQHGVVREPAEVRVAPAKKPRPKPMNRTSSRVARAQAGAFQCDHCPKRFTSRRGWRVHVINTHDSAVRKEFGCRYCDKMFLYASLARNHEAQHTGEAVIACRACSARFTSSDRRHEHEAAEHAQILPYTCNVCHTLGAHPRRCGREECGGDLRRTILTMTSFPKNLLCDASLLDVME